MFAHDRIAAPFPLTVLRKRNDLVADYHDLRGTAKAEVIDSLRPAQHDRCAYCETSVRNSSKVRLEHFHPQSSTGEGSAACNKEIGGASLSQSDLEYGNMLLCCDGHEGQSQTTCDVRKRDKDICADFHNPKHQRTATLVRVRSDGTILPQYFPGTGAAAERVITDVLRLNATQLADTRSTIYMAGLREATKRLAAGGGKVPRATLRRQLADALERRAEIGPYPFTLLSLAEDVRSGYRRP